MLVINTIVPSADVRGADAVRRVFGNVQRVVFPRDVNASYATNVILAATTA